jgi:hypothetical protein
MDRKMFTTLVLALILTTACPPPPTPTPSFPPPLSTATGYSADCQAAAVTLTLNANQTGSFQVICTNTGTTSWVRGTATEASLATCCPVGANVSFSTWGVSGGRYATQSTSAVAPGSIGTFSFNVTVPSGTARGTYMSDGALVNGNNQPISAQILTFTVSVP